MDIKNELLRQMEMIIVGTDDKNEVINKMTRLLHKYDITEKSTELTIYDDSNEKLLKRFLATKRIEGKSENTIKRYHDSLMHLLNTINIPIAQITTFDLRFYLGMKKEEGLQSSSLDGMRRVYSSFFGWLLNEGFIPKNPCATLHRIKFHAEKEKPFSMAELQKLRETSTTDRDLALVDFLYSTGCRISEVTSINLEDIDWHDMEIVVIGKGNKPRTVYFDDITAMHLKKYLNKRTDNSPALFQGKGTDRLSANAIRKILNNIGEKAGVTNVHPHRFRKTLATNLLSHGMSIDQVAQILGHEDIKTTQIY